jgi:hypothetical protein
MSLQQLVQALQESALADWMRYTPRAMPVVEATHVLAAIAVFGTLLFVDLRLLGVRDARQPFSWISRQILPITWSAFGIGVSTGVLMFLTSAQVYSGNAAFRFKMLALLGAGLNMAFFQLVTLRGVAAWDQGKPTRAARVAGAISLLLWATVVLLGRWIGFTKGYDFTIPAGAVLDFGD